MAGQFFLPNMSLSMGNRKTTLPKASGEMLNHKGSAQLNQSEAGVQMICNNTCVLYIDCECLKDVYQCQDECFLFIFPVGDLYISGKQKFEKFSDTCTCTSDNDQRKTNSNKYPCRGASCNDIKYCSA